MGFVESIMATSYTSAPADDYPASAEREAAQQEGGGKILNEWYEFEKYINRRGDQLAKHPAFRHLSSTYWLARRHALEIFPDEQAELSVQEVRRREIKTLQDPLTVLPTTANTQTIDGFGSYGDEEWTPGSKATLAGTVAEPGARNAAAVAEEGAATDSEMADYDTVTASSRAVFGPSGYSPDPQTVLDTTDDSARLNAPTSSPLVSTGPTATASTAPGAPGTAESSMIWTSTATTSPGTVPPVHAQMSRANAATGPAPSAVMTAASSASPKPTADSTALRIDTHNLDQPHITASTGSSEHCAVSSPPRKARDSAHATPDASPVSTNRAGTASAPTVPSFPAHADSSLVQETTVQGSELPEEPFSNAQATTQQLTNNGLVTVDSRTSAMEGTGFQVLIKSSKRPLASTQDDTEELAQNGPPPKRTKTASPPVEGSKRPFASTQDDAEELDQSEPPPKRAKTASAPDAAAPRKIRGVAQVVKKSATAAPPKRAARKPAATQLSKRAASTRKANLEPVISGAALPQNQQEAQAASAERKAGLLSAHMASKRSRSKKAPDLMPEFFETSNFPESEKGDVVRCICGCIKDDGANMISCEGKGCEVWQHSKCMLPGLKKKEVDEYEGYLCQVCGPWERREVVGKMRQSRSLS